MPWTLKTAPPEEPVTLTEVKDHLRLDTSDQDTLLKSLIQASREHVESVTNRALVEQTRIAYFERFPEQDYIELPGAPLQSVNSVTYTDSDGQEQTLDSSNYSVVTATEPGRVVLGYSKLWPSAVLVHDAYPVKVEYICGYEADETADSTDYTANIPESLKNAILLDVEIRFDRPPEDYQKRLKSVIDSLLAPYRVWSF